MKYKGILFDFNGTMFMDSDKHKEAWNEFSQRYRKKPIQDYELVQMHGQTNKKIIEQLMAHTLEDTISQQLSVAKEALYRECCMNDVEHFHLSDGLVSLLDKLKTNGIPMTICTASIYENVAFFIESFQLSTWFQTANIVYDDGKHHDKVSMFLAGADNIGIPIEDCVVFEDSLSGIEFARKAGVGKIIAVTTPDQLEEYKQLKGVDEVIHNFYDFDISDFE